MTDNVMETKRKTLPVTPFRIMGNQLVSPVISFNGSKKNISLSVKKIDRLDEIIATNKQLSFTLRFPFQENFEFTIYPTENGFSRILIINEIRRAYRSIFRQQNGASARWETKTTKDGIESFLVDYPLKGLYVEKIMISNKDNRLYVFSDCSPEIKKKDDLPF